MNACRLMLLMFAVTPLINSASADPPTPKKPVTEEEARAFCEEFAERFMEGDGLWLSDHIDIPGMAWRATDGQKDAFSKGFREGASKRTDGVLRSVQNLVTQKDTFQSYKFTRLRQAKGTWKGLFRLIAKDEAMNFHELELTRKSNGEIGAAEFYNYMTGETLTDTFRKICEDAKDTLKKNAGNEKSLEGGYDRVGEMSAALREKNYQTVVDLYGKIPADLQKSKVVMTLLLQAAANLDEKLYQQVMEDYAKEFPNDPSKDFISIDAFFLAKKYDLAIQAIDRLLERTGGDGHLSFLKATLNLLDEKPEQAIRSAKDGMKQEPDYGKLYEITLNASLQTKDNALTKEMLDTLESKFGFEFADLKSVPEYANFVKSPEYEAYLKSKEDAKGEAKPEF
ncbi:hypothetical protein K2Y11_02680 [bacterium]|nr:hypothetical protein [bacterium]